MKDIWLPGWVRKDLGPDGGPYDDMKTPKGCVHTTEGSGIAGAEAAYKGYPPHLGYDPVRRTKRQYVALNRYSYAFRWAETDDEFIIQVEVVGYADQTHTWPDIVYKNFAEDVLKPLEDAVGIPRRHLRFYRDDEGIVLARKTSPIRLRPAALRKYSGWLGHQHVPGLNDQGVVMERGDEHWDPGGFLMDKAFSFVPGKQADKEDPAMQLVRERDKKEVWVGDYISRRWVSGPELEHLEARFGKVGVINPGTVDVFGTETAESKARRGAAAGSGGPLPGDPS